MSKIKITTLTPVHVGSGNFLQNNSEFVYFKSQGNPYLGIIDERKILDLIGVNHLNDWVLSIERQDSTKDLVKRYAPQSHIGDYLKRYEPFYADELKASDTLKECMHNGMGVPYLPGSSLKGAIRTAITAILAKRNMPVSIDKNKLKSLASDVEGRLFGKDPTEDIFRFIQIGDAYFDRNCEIALRLIMSINITKQDSLFPKENNLKPQLVEAIGTDEESTFSIKIDTDAYRRCKSTMPRMGTLPEEIQTLQGLFQLINNHTMQLVSEEIEYWHEISKGKSGADVYIEQMQEMFDAVKSCDSKSCVLRLGHSSGWRFITGAWGEHLDCFDTDIVNLARPNNRNYTEYDFPKSRRTDSEGYLLGFVKLSI